MNKKIIIVSLFDFRLMMNYCNHVHHYVLVCYHIQRVTCSFNLIFVALKIKNLTLCLAKLKGEKGKRK